MTIAWARRTAFAGRTFSGSAFDRERWSRLADVLAVALAISLPWSTSATGILAGLWLIVLVPTLDPQALRRVLATPAGGLPVLLWGLGLAGMLWADVSWAERLNGLNPFHKLLCIPLLMVQFQRSDRGPWLMAGFLGSCTLLLILSFALVTFPAIPWPNTVLRGVPVKNYAAQSELFTICVFLLAELAREYWLRGRRAVALVAVVLSLAFLANILFVATTRTSLVVIPIVLLLYGYRRLGWRGIAMALTAAVLAAALAWTFSPFLQKRVGGFMAEVHDYRSLNQRTSAGERLEFWRKSIGFITHAPVLGHGTGTIRDQFRKAVVGETGASAVISANPHNQTLAVAIQLGLVGVAVLFAMWIAHLVQFRAVFLAAPLGIVVVVQNMIGSLFNSQLFDFTHGWAYVIGVGVAGGMMLRAGVTENSQA